jgi:Na+-driven multidrug efflux pump
MQLGMGSALETLCGQAYGAKQLHMMGVYLQRSWVILNAMAVLMLPLYLSATPILCLFHQDAEIADLAGRLALYMIPQLFAYAFNFPIQKFLQAQSKVMAMAAVSAVALAFHVALSWVLVGACGWGSSASPSPTSSWATSPAPGTDSTGSPSPTSSASRTSPWDPPSCSGACVLHYWNFLFFLKR